MLNLESGTAIATLEGHRAIVSDVAINSDGTRAISGIQDEIAKVWDLSTGAAIATLDGHNDSVNKVAITADGTFAVTAGGGTAKLWDVTTGTVVGILEHPQVWSGNHPDGSRVVTAGLDKTTGSGNEPKAAPSGDGCTLCQGE